MRRLLAFVAFSFALSACAVPGPSTSQPNSNTAAILAGVKVSLSLAGDAIASWEKMPQCGMPGATAICPTPARIDAANKTLATAETAVDFAQTTLQTVGTDATTAQKVVSIASQAVASVISLLANFGLLGTG